MNKEELLKRIEEIQAEKKQMVNLINQHNSMISELQAQHNGLEGARLECLRMVKLVDEKLKETLE